MTALQEQKWFLFIVVVMFIVLLMAQKNRYAYRISDCEGVAVLEKVGDVDSSYFNGTVTEIKILSESPATEGLQELGWDKWYRYQVVTKTDKWSKEYRAAVKREKKILKKYWEGKDENVR